MLLPLLHLQRDSLGRTWCCGVSGWTELLGWAKGGHIPAHISGDSVGHVSPLLAVRADVPASRCWAEGGQVAGKCSSATSWPGHPLGLGPRGSTGLGAGICHGPLPALRSSGRAECNRASAESAFGNYSLTEASPALFNASLGPVPRNRLSVKGC